MIDYYILRWKSTNRPSSSSTVVILLYSTLLTVLFLQIECQNPCLNGGVLMKGSDTCICQRRFFGQRCEINLDLLTTEQRKQFGCALRPCWIGSTCEDLTYKNGTFFCHCSANQYGEYCEKSSFDAFDPCQSKPCYNYGQCVRQDQNSYTCLCNGTYGGLSCKASLYGACANNPCQRDGICIPIGQFDYKCNCPDWTVGKNCETVFNPCKQVTCSSNGVCAKKRTLAYECTCNANYTGAMCEQHIGDTCKLRPCENGGVCELNVQGKLGCTCKTSGYEGAFCESDKCPSKCKNGYCDKDGVGGFRCYCYSGYEGADCGQKKSISCFPADTLVDTLERGQVRLDELVRGEHVRAYDHTQHAWLYSRFVVHMHSNHESLFEYLLLSTRRQRTLKISSKHLIARRKMTSASSSSIEYVFAQELRVNDKLIVDGESEDDELVSIDTVWEQGAFAPLVETGTLAVNSLLASCYAYTRMHNLVHAVFKPIVVLSRYFDVLTSSSVVEQHDSFFWYADFLYTSLLPFIPFSSYIVHF